MADETLVQKLESAREAVTRALGHQPELREKLLPSLRRLDAIIEHQRATVLPPDEVPQDATERRLVAASALVLAKTHGRSHEQIVEALREELLGLVKTGSGAGKQADVVEQAARAVAARIAAGKL